MYELDLVSQREIMAGGDGEHKSFGSYVIYIIIGTAIYKLLKSSSGRISIPKLVTFEWK